MPPPKSQNQRRSRARSTIKTPRTALNDKENGDLAHSNNDKALIVGPVLTHPSRYKPILSERPTMLQFAPYEKDRSSRSYFILMIYLTTLIILMLALLQWEMVSLYDPLQNLFRKDYWISIICFFIAAVLLALFMLIREARYMPIFNWVQLVFIIELIVIGICTLAAYWEPVTLMVYFLLSLFLVIICLLIGTYIPLDITANVAAIFLISILFCILSQQMIVLHVINSKWNGYYFTFAFLIMCIVFMFVMYHAQLVQGGRYAEISATDGLFAVIVLFCHFCLIFILFAYAIWPQLNASNGQSGEYRSIYSYYYNNDDNDDDDNIDDDNNNNDDDGGGGGDRDGVNIGTGNIERGGGYGIAAGDGRSSDNGSTGGSGGDGGG